MLIGVLPDLDPSHGGAYQYSLSMLDALSRVACTEEHRFDVMVRPGQQWDPESLSWAVVTESGSRMERATAALRGRVGNGRLREALRRARRVLRIATANSAPLRRHSVIRKWTNTAGLDWILQTAPDPDALNADVPFVMPIFDLQHRIHPEFPEVGEPAEWRLREQLYCEGTRRALLVLADSETGKEDILEFYGKGITADRIKVVPYVPAPYLPSEVPAERREQVRARHELPADYFFYPAQFWPHKNHLRVVQALGQAGLRDAHVVFCGSHSGKLRAETFESVVHEARSIGAAGRVHYLGYVANEEMAALYASAIALVMPTFFGPTNIPVVEAWRLGCPVVTSDIRGVREHAADAALLADPSSVDAIGAAMRRIRDDDALRATLIANGRRHLELHGREQFDGAVRAVVTEACERVALLR